MVRGAEYDNGIPQSDNAIEAGETKAHGVGNNVCLPIQYYNHLNISNILFRRMPL